MISAFLCLPGCADRTVTTAGGEKKTVERVNITQFYAPQSMVPRGLKGSLCYGVEHAARVELSPAVDQVWPAPARCIEISPSKKTRYTLTAYGEDGSRESKSIDVDVGAPPPRLYDLSVNATHVHPGERVMVCFKLENARDVKASPGKLDKGVNCLTDNPKKTTTYRITAMGGDHQEDAGTVTVNVR